MKSIESRISDLNRALDQAAAEETPIAVDLITATTRAEALTLQALPPLPAPDAPRVRLIPTHYAAADYLAARGIALPQPPTEITQEERNEG
jgi:hypothetical protein